MAESGKKIATVWNQSADARLRRKLKRIRAHDAAIARECLAIGDKTPDGDVFAGLSPETRQPMYAAPADLPSRLPFKEAWQQAETSAEKSQKSYRVPSEKELNMLFNNRAAIGGFNLSGGFPAGLYWSSSEGDDIEDSGRSQNFSNGNKSNNLKILKLSVRLVRS